MITRRRAVARGLHCWQYGKVVQAFGPPDSPAPARKRRLHCNTLVATSNPQVNLLKGLDRVKSYGAPRNGVLNVTALLSQELTSLTDPGAPFTHQFVNALVGKCSGGSPHTTNLLLGVVDRLLSPSNDLASRSSVGLSYMINDGAPSSNPPSTHHPHGYITFKDCAGSPDAFHPSPLSQVDLPLANTMFSNGHQFTLLHASFAHSRFSVSPLRSIQTSLGWVKSAAIPLSLSTMIPDLHVPLRALTIPRRISGAMGNIIRTLSSPSGLLPASLELESALNDYVQLNHGQIRKIFALLMPEAPSPLQTSSMPWNELLLGESPQARLYRVLSGGGGWGDKAGLLSLDPDPLIPDEGDVGGEYFVRQKGASAAAAKIAARAFGSDAALRTYAAEVEALGDTARMGMYVQFFVADFDVERSGMEDATTAKASSSGMQFGCIPLREEHGYVGKKASPRDADQQSGRAECKVLEGHFGAMSEKGFGLNQHKIDVPGACISVRT